MPAAVRKGPLCVGATGRSAESHGQVKLMEASSLRQLRKGWRLQSVLRCVQSTFVLRLVGMARRTIAASLTAHSLDLLLLRAS